MNPGWLLLPCLRQDVYMNMALDEWLFGETLRSGQCYARISRMEGPAITIGYFQKAQRKSPLAEPWTRRLTGGGLVHHGSDWIVSLTGILPAGPRPLSRIYETIHRSLWSLLVSRFPDLTLLNTATGAKASRESDCFASPVPFDLLQGQTKVAGGALCRRGKFYLYQGSVHCELKDALPPDESLLPSGFGVALEKMFAVPCRQGTWPIQALPEAEKIARLQYADKSWRFKH